jgi:hypothetical protein
MRHSKDGLQAQRVVFRIHAAPLKRHDTLGFRPGSRPADDAVGTSKRQVKSEQRPTILR